MSPHCDSMHCLCHFLNWYCCEVTGDEKNPPLDKVTRRNNTEAREGKEKINQKKNNSFSPTLPSKTSWKTPHNKCRFSVSLPFFFFSSQTFNERKQMHFVSATLINLEHRNLPKCIQNRFAKNITDITD